MASTEFLAAFFADFVSIFRVIEKVSESFSDTFGFCVICCNVSSFQIFGSFLGASFA